MVVLLVLWILLVLCLGKLIIYRLLNRNIAEVVKIVGRL